jgi:hypothetical protein
VKNLHLRRRAYLEYNKALKDGTLYRPSTCSECGCKGAMDGHHHDYAEPLAVEWLCRSCHHKRHVPQIHTSNASRPRCIACGRIIYRHLVRHGRIRQFGAGVAHVGQCARTAGVRQAQANRASKEATAYVA